MQILLTHFCQGVYLHQTSERKSMDRYSNVVFCFSRKQQSVKLFLLEAEYVVAAETISELLYQFNEIEFVVNFWKMQNKPGLFFLYNFVALSCIKKVSIQKLFRIKLPI